MFIIQCPHCSIFIEIVEINCKIFRCGIFKHNFQQIPPHLSESECNALALSGNIYRCSKPFILDDDSTPQKCDYI